ncbi:MAG: helix-turn-helix domain-containing protein, partial [Candidatus ainarchaeum sp.]|nr:helix-turn-helix domain-containing protein [Candidatus ainarchaeum sp.]
MSKVKLAAVGVYHHDCQTSLSSEKFPGITLEQLSPVVYFSKKPEKVDYSLLWRVSANSPSELDQYLSYVKNDAKTKSLRLLEKGKTNAHILLRFKGATSTYDKVMSSGVTYASNIHAKAGYEVHTVVSSDISSLGKMLKELSAIGDVKIIKAGNYKTGALSQLPNFTNKQIDALQLALMSDYYKWPRGATLEKLAKAAHLSRRSMQERLRRAESKLLPFA